MRVQFDYTIDDLVDVQMRLLKRSRAVQAWRWRDLVLTSLLTGVLLFALIPQEIIVRIIVGIIGLLLGAVLYPVVNEMTVKRRLRKWTEENVGSARTFTCEVELDESGLHTQSNDAQIIFDWRNVEEIKETEDSVDIYFAKGGLMVTRNRAFTSTEERQRFIELAKQYSKVAEASRL